MIRDTTCQDFEKIIPDFCRRSSLLDVDSKKDTPVSSDTRLETCCRREARYPSYMSTIDRYKRVNTKRSFESFKAGVQIFFNTMKGAKNELTKGYTDLPWQYGNFQQTTCVSAFSNTDEAAQIKYDSMRYLDDFNKILKNFEKHMNQHVRFGDYPYTVEFHDAPVKGIARMAEKNYGKYSPVNKHSCREVTDACRGSLYFSNIYGVVEFMDLLKKRIDKDPVIYNRDDCEETDPMFCLPCDIKRIEFTNVKNRMTRNDQYYKQPSEPMKSLQPYDVLYRDILINIKMFKSDYDFHVAEIQVHLEKMAHAKKHGGHTFYRVIRQQTESVAKFDSKFGSSSETEGEAYWVRKPEDWWKLDVLRYVPVGCGDGECVEVEDYLKSGDTYDEKKEKKNYEVGDLVKTCKLPDDVGGKTLKIPDTWKEYLSDEKFPSNLAKWKQEWVDECTKRNKDLSTQQRGANVISTARRQSAIAGGTALGNMAVSKEATNPCDSRQIPNEEKYWKARAQVQMAIDMSKCLYSNAWKEMLDNFKKLIVGAQGDKESEKGGRDGDGEGRGDGDGERGRDGDGEGGRDGDGEGRGDGIVNDILTRLRTIGKKTLVRHQEHEVVGNKLALEFLECQRANSREAMRPDIACCEIETCRYVEFSKFDDSIKSEDVDLTKIQEESTKRETVVKRCVHEMSAQAHICAEQDYRPEILFRSEFRCEDDSNDCTYMHCKEGRKCLKKGCDDKNKKSCKLTCTRKKDYCADVRRERCHTLTDEELEEGCCVGTKGPKPRSELHKYSFVYGAIEDCKEHCCVIDKETIERREKASEAWANTVKKSSAGGNAQETEDGETQVASATTEVVSSVQTEESI